MLIEAYEDGLNTGVQLKVDGPPPLDLVMFSELTWGGTWYSRHHLISGLARRNRVFYVEEPASWRDVVSRPASALRSVEVQKDAYDVLRIQPARWLPDIGRPEGMRRALFALRAHQLTRYLARAGAMRPIVYVWNPEFQESVSRLRPAHFVYHCYDKYDRYQGVCSQRTHRRESWLVRSASLCVAASAELAAHLESLGARNVLELRHGVAIEEFKPNVQPHPDLERIPGPRLGLTARINEVLDVETLSYIARTRPDWSLVLVGGAYYSSDTKRERFEALCRLPNVYYVGERPRAEVPSWLCGFDVGLMCYDRATWAPYNQPIKMYEYLACGLPVVSTDIRAARELEQVVKCCDQPADWLAQIESALRERGPRAAAQRVAFAAANRWDQRVAVLQRALQDLH